MNNENYKIRQIPDNYDVGVNVGGFHFKAIFLIEGIILGVIFIGISFSLLLLCKMKDIGQMMGISLVFGGISFAIGVKGINDEPVTTFLKNYRFFKKNKRIAYYNPRIKLEAKPFDTEEVNKDNLLPKEKINIFLSKYKEKNNEKQQEKASLFEKENALDMENMFFEDDIFLKHQKESKTK